MKNKFEKLASMMLILIMMISLSIPVMADEETILNDFNDIKTLDAEYSYGKIAIDGDLSETNVEKITATFYNNKTATDEKAIYYGAYLGQVISFKIKQCAIDMNGQMCDAICNITDVALSGTGAPQNNLLGNQFIGTNYSNENDVNNVTIGTDEFPIVSIKVSKSAIDNKHIDFNIYNNYANCKFSIKYVKTGTEEAATLNKAVAFVKGIDTQPEGSIILPNSLWNGNEGVSLGDATGKVYYKKTDGCLIATDDNKGVRVKDAGQTTLPSTEGIHKETSAVFVETLTNTKEFSMVHAGPGISNRSVIFGAPYTYDLPTPTKTVDKTKAFEQDTIIYNLTQYVPNNYVAETLNELNISTGTKYKSFVISDDLNSNITLSGETSALKVYNESNVDKTNYFDIVKNTDNKLTITAKTDTLTNTDFYGHFYKIQIPVTINEGAGQNVSKITNTAKTTTTFNTANINGEEKISTPVNETGLQYKINISANIQKGTTKINEGTAQTLTTDTIIVNHGENSTNKIYFTPEAGYEVTGITINGGEAKDPEDVSGIVKNGNVFTYTITDENIRSNNTHNIVINTISMDETEKDTEQTDEDPNQQQDENEKQKEEKKSAEVIVNYLDEEGKVIAPTETINGKVGDKYTAQQKTISGYKIYKIPSNYTGLMTEKAIIVNYIYSKITTVKAEDSNSESSQKIEESDEIDESDKIDELPKTGNSEIYIIGIVALLLYAIVTFVIGKKKFDGIK